MRTITSILVILAILVPAGATLKQAPKDMHYEVRVDQDTINRYIETISADLQKSGIKDLEISFNTNRIVIEGSVKKVVWIGFQLGFKLSVTAANTFKMTCDQFEVLGFVPLKKSWLIGIIHDSLKEHEKDIKNYVTWTKKDDNITFKVTPPNQAILPDLSLNACYVGNSGLVFWGKYNK